MIPFVMPSDTNRLIFGPFKYAAFHLLLAKWIRHYAPLGECVYVTLGGTELRDAQNFHFIDPRLATDAVSYEEDRERHALAEQSAEKLAAAGVAVRIEHGSFFDYVRNSDLPHLFFLDLEGNCACSSADYHLRFADMFQNGTLREGDSLLITSYLGRNVGWERLYQRFDAEFRILQLPDEAAKRLWYRRAHPSFTLFKALTSVDLQNELLLSCFGAVEYRDRSPMAIYGYTISAGQTRFLEFIRNTPHFHAKYGYGARL